MMYKELISPRFYNRKSEKYGEYKCVEFLGVRGKTEVPYFKVKFKNTNSEIEVPLKAILENRVIDTSKKKSETKKRRISRKKTKIQNKRVQTFKSDITVPERYKMVVLDISSSSTGYAEFDCGKLVDYGNFSISKKSEPRTIIRLNEICSKVIRMLQEKRPNIVVIENVLQKTKRVLYALAMGHGIILNYLVDNNIEFRRVDVNAWKFYAGIPELKKRYKIGTDRQKTKLATLDFVKNKFSIDLRKEDYNEVEIEVSAWEDRADSICIGYYAINNLIKH